MKCIIAGTRTINNQIVVNQAINKSGWKDEITEVVSGHAPGIDTCGERWAMNNGVPIMAFPAEWKIHGKAAGPIRNKQMAEYADALILIWDGKSKGSANMLEHAQRYGLKVYQHLVTEKETR